MRELPLFPLGLVHFPGAPLPLYIFEERYKEMIGWCVEHAEPFGILFQDGGKVCNVGTMCLVEHIVHQWEDGRMHILVRGTERFRVSRFLQDRAYLRGDIEPLGDAAETVDREAIRTMGQHFLAYWKLRRQELDSEEARQLINDAFERLPEIEATETPSLRLLPLIAIEPRRKQEFLEMTSENERVQRLIRILKESIIAYNRLYRIKGLLGTNGHFPPAGGEWQYFSEVDYL